MPVKAYLNLFVQIVLLVRGPQDVPYSHTLFRMVLVLYFVTGLTSLLTVDTMGDALYAMLLDVSLLLVFSLLILRSFAKPSRFIQMTTALLAVGCLFQVLDVPLLWYLQQVKAANEQAPFASLILLLLMSWNLAVYAHIIRHSLDVRMPVAFVLTLCYVIMAVMSRQLLIPSAGA